MSALQHEAIPAMAPERFAPVLSAGEYEALLDLVGQSLRDLHGRGIWNVNSTAKGGGVVEMLRPLLGYCRGAGASARHRDLARSADGWPGGSRAKYRRDGYVALSRRSRRRE